MPEFDPLVRPPDAPSLSSVMGAFQQLANIPTIFRKAAIDQAKVDAINQLKKVALVDPATGQVNPAAYGQMATALLATNPQAALDAIALGQQQQDLTTAQGIMGRYTGGAPSGAASATGGAVSFSPQVNSTLTAAANQYGVDPNLYSRLINQESGGNPAVRDSPAGAQGIAQFMPGTARQYGVNPRDPQSSLYGGARYLRDMIDRFGGNVGLGVAAYNWGPERVEAWVARGAPPNQVPAETRNYVRNITGESINDWAAQRTRLSASAPPREPAPRDTGTTAIAGSGTRDDPYQVSAEQKKRIPDNSYYVPKSRPNSEPRLKAPAQSSDTPTRVAEAGATRAPRSANLPELTEQALLASAPGGTPAGRIALGFEALSGQPPPSAGAVTAPAERIAQGFDAMAGQPPPRVAALPPTGAVPAPAAVAAPPGAVPPPTVAPPGAAPPPPGAAPAGPELIHPEPLPPGYGRWQDAYDDMRRDGLRLLNSRSQQAQAIGKNLLAQADRIRDTHAPQEVYPNRPIYDPETRQWTMPPVMPGARGGRAAVEYDLLQKYRQEHPNSTAEEEQAFLQSGRSAGRSAIAQYMARWSAEHPKATAEQFKLAQQQYQRQLTAQNRFFSGPQGNTIRSLDVVVSHIGVMEDMITALNNGQTQLFNSMAQRWAEASGQPEPTNFKTAAQIVGTEIMKALTNAGVGTGAERGEMQHRFDVAESPDQLRGTIDTARRLLAGQVNGLRRQFKQSTGLGDDDFNQFLSPGNIEWYEGKDGTSQAPRWGTIININPREGYYSQQPGGQRAPASAGGGTAGSVIRYDTQGNPVR